VHPGLTLSAGVRDSLVDIWRTLLANEALTLCVFEDPTLPYPRCVEGFVAAVFVTAEFARDFLATPRPHLSALVYEAILANRSPVLSQREIARENSGCGLQSLTLHLDFRERDFSSPRMTRILTAAAESGRFFRAGYRMNLAFGVLYGHIACVLRDGGWPIFKLPWAAPSACTVTAANDLQPYLVVQDKEHVPASPLHGHMLFFHAPPAVLGFSRAEQRVLERALLEESDAVIADDLGISLDAVKQTWRRAFDRVGRVMPYVIPVDTEVSDTRGCEKRRHLVHYLRGHLEELRPHVMNSPKRGLSRPSRHC
jgi:hypothetical protein